MRGKGRSTTRRVELVEIMRRPAPLDYRYQPANRQQRRQLKRAIRRSAQRTTTGR